MPIEKVLGTSLQYYLISFDEKANERPEDGELLSQKILDVLSNQPITDVFFMSHGWQSDIDAANDQYQAWIAAMANNKADLQKIQQLRPGFSPLLIGLHWPSKPWGNENLNPQLPASDTAENSQFHDLIEDYAHEVSDTEISREALKVIFTAGIEYDTPPDSLPPEIFAASQALIKDAFLTNQGEDTNEWSKTELLDFDPQTIYQASLQKQTTDIGTGIGDRIASAWDSFLNVPRLLSFWKKKDLARQIGETTGFNLLNKLQQVADDRVRFHLMGHSFGTILVSATVAGSQSNNKLVRPINSLALIQGAVSLWSYSANVPYKDNLVGYFYPIIAENKVTGPIITTQSQHDNALKIAYPVAGTIGLGIGKDINFEIPTPKYPRVGGIGIYGIQGQGLDITNIDMLPVEKSYDFKQGKIYNLESSQYIAVPNPDPFIGAHNAIDKPEVAHAFWSAALSS